MPRHPRLFIPEATHHVYCPVSRGEFVFYDPFEAAEFVLFDHHSGYTIEDIRSSLRRPMHLQARIGSATLGVSRYEDGSMEVARFIQKHPTSVARWISLGLRKQLEDRSFCERVDDIDRQNS